MSSNILMSIIVPVYNAESTIERCIGSIFGGHLSDRIECIAIDDHSTDGTAEILRRACSDHKNLRAVCAKGFGVSAARNTGLELASGEFIGFCDADDFYEKDAPDNAAEIMSEKRLDILMTGRFRTVPDGNGGFEKRPFVYKREMTVKPAKAMSMVLCSKTAMGSVCNKFYRRSVIGGKRFDETLSHCEDTCFNISVMSCGRLNILAVPTAMYNYVANARSATCDPEQLFNERAELNYTVSMKKIIADHSLPRRLKTDAGCAAAALAIENYGAAGGNGLKRKNLRADIGKYFPCLCARAFRYDPAYNLRLICKGMLILLRLR